MRIAAHSYNNDVFKSLKDILDENIGKEAENTTSQLKEALSLSSVTQNDFDNIQAEKTSDVAAELVFAASNYDITITKDDLKSFAKKSEDLRGKDLERAARHFCGKLASEHREPQGTRKMAEAQDNPIAHTVSAATVAPGEKVEQGNQGFLGMSKNPNTIWDSGALQRAAQSMSNDEKTKAEKNKAAAFKAQQKESQWDKQAEGGDVITKGIMPSGNTEAAATGHKLPANSMSMFDDDRDFSNIPKQSKVEDTEEEIIPEIKGTKKSDNSGEFLFAEQQEEIKRGNTSRSALDRLFDVINKKDQLE